MLVAPLFIRGVAVVRARGGCVIGHERGQDHAESSESKSARNKAARTALR